MILVDANLLLYAFVPDLPEHEVARKWLEEQLTGAARVGLPWAALLTFVRIVTNPRMFERPASMPTAWAQVESWLDAEPAWVPTPTPRHRQVLARWMQPGTLRANDVPDAHLAGLAVEHGLRLATNDRGFARFDTLTWFNPLADPPGG